MLKYLLAISFGFSLVILGACGKNPPAKYPNFTEDGYIYVRRNDSIFFKLAERGILIRLPPTPAPGEEKWQSGPIPDQEKAVAVTHHNLYNEKVSKATRRSTMEFALPWLKEYIENTTHILRIAEQSKIEIADFPRPIHLQWRKNARTIIDMIDLEHAPYDPKPSATPKLKPSPSPKPRLSGESGTTTEPERVPLPRPRPKRN